MIKGAAGFIVSASVAFAALLGYGLGVPDVGAITASAPTISDFFGHSSTIRNWNLHWPSVGVGIASGILLALLCQISWFEIPRSIIRWIIANERNFYRIGVAGACLAVLFFY